MNWYYTPPEERTPQHQEAISLSDRLVDELESDELGGEGLKEAIASARSSMWEYIG